jgi:transcriptional regulator with XRE-family HTH domain
MPTDRGARAELGSFLRTKRKLLTPSDFGVMESVRRRTAGLRREEVAEFAGVGFTWYTWLEQGRDIHPSDGVLGRLSRVLQLNDVEIRHVRELAGCVQPAPDAELSDGALGLQPIVDAMQFPACVRNARYDVLVWNAAFSVLFGSEGAPPPFERNVLWRLFTKHWGPAEILCWEELAKTLVADFRMTYGKVEPTHECAALIAALRDVSPVFRGWWDDFVVGERPALLFHTAHPKFGIQQWDMRHFDVGGPGKPTLVLFTPVELSCAAGVAMQ